MKSAVLIAFILATHWSIGQSVTVHELILSAQEKEKEGKKEEAIATVEKAIELSQQKNDTALLLHGNLLSEKNEIKAAYKDANKVISHNKYSAEAYYLRATLKAKSENFEGAIHDFTNAIRYNPNNHKAYYNRGLAHALLNEIKQAIAEFSKAIELYPGYSMAYFNRGYWKHFLGNTDDALLDLLKAKELNPENPDLLLELAVLYAEKNKMDEACYELELASKLGHSIAEELKMQFCK